MKKKEIELDFAKLWINEDGIIHVRFKPGTTLTIERMQALLETFRLLSDLETNRVLFYITGLKPSSKEEREYAASEDIKKATKAAAFIAASPLAKMMGNLLIKINKPPYPIRLFTEEEKALTWLRGFEDQDDS